MLVEEEPLVVVDGKPDVSILRCKTDADRYTWGCVVSYHWPYVAVLKLVLTAPTLKEARLVRKFLTAKGLTVAEFERRRDGASRLVRLHG